MNTKSVFLCSLVLAVFAYAPCGAQQLPVAATPLGTPPALPADGMSSAMDDSKLVPSDWIRYSQPECCNSIGCDGPLKTELYYRIGASFPMGGGDFPQRLNSVGYTIQGGARELFFNVPRTAAWVVDLGISFNSDASSSNDPVQLNILVQDGTAAAPDIVKRDIQVTIRHLYRTFANVGVGREWYLWAPADQPGSKWRVGMDLGGRVGVARADFNEITHRTDNLWGAFVAIHSDWEIPCGSCIWMAGVRTEWGYSWMGILQSFNNSDIADLGLMLNLGVRF
ncbi:MAG TPA: hypothetical protein VGP68_06295 [Gemmataceae bacterium]|jgi:hypothetical protein|nr:hypothetical protein [Gemmataceae bacterium]